MNSKYILAILILLIACKKSEPITSDYDAINITPKPLKIIKRKGSFTITDDVTFFTGEHSSEVIAEFFIEKIKNITGLELKVSKNDQRKNTIKLNIDTTLNISAEGYFLESSPKEVVIRAAGPQGIFYGMQTFLQLLSATTVNGDMENTNWKIPVVEVQDQPAFLWRGLHLDVSRHFTSIDFIQKQLDVLAMFKMNKFHWHLTDDQGWRIEIKKYPRLTEIGSKRRNHDNSVHEGYYTQNEIKEVVAYAKKRFIDVIPELETPGHAIAALAAYPELACHTGTYKTRELWGVESNVFCAGKIQTYDFLEDVIDEMVKLFPYEYFHVGGDEVPKEKWETCPNCQKRIKKEGLKDEKELQSYFLSRIEKVLKKYNKKMIGWDEILEGGITPTTNIMSWQGEEGGIKAANEGHDVIMTPIEYTYLNFYQGDHKVEPLAFGGYIPLEKVYNYHPIPVEIAENKRKHILGAQGNLWTEYAPTERDIEYLIYPRIIALAETTWTAKDNKNFDDFLHRLTYLYPKLDDYNINYHIPLPEGPSSNFIVFVDSVTVEFNTTHPVKMIYTTDGTDPTLDSKVYTDPLLLKKNTQLKIASVLPNGKKSAVRELFIRKQAPFEPEKVENLTSGLVMKTINGHFTNVDQIDTLSHVQTSRIKEIKDANRTYHMGYEVKKENFRAVFLEGYIEIPESGVYFFSSAQDQVWIADQLVINHKGIIKKHPVDRSIALKKGKHKLKIIYLNNIIKGWASDWNVVELQYRKSTETDYNIVDGGMIFR